MDTDNELKYINFRQYGTKKQDYQYIFTANVQAAKVFEGISDIPGWWVTDMEGSAHKLNDIFTVHFGDVSVTFKVIKVVPNKKIVWLVTDCNLSWLKDKKEWKDTLINWEVSDKGHTTQIIMTHIGLVPELECYMDCTEGWNFHVGESLFKLLSENKGLPDIRTRK